MNILLVNKNLGTAHCVGGIETHSEILAPVLAERGHNVVVGCWTDGTLVTNTGGKAVRAKRIRIRNSGDIGAIVRMATLCRNEDINVIIANSGHEYWPTALAAKITGTKIVFVRHQVDRLKKITAWLINRHVDKVIAVSGAVRDALLRSGVSNDKIEMVHNAVALDRFAAASDERDVAKKELGIGPDDIVVGSVGKLNKGKGVFDILAAFHLLSGKYPNLKLLFVGGGPERQAIEEEAMRLSVRDRVILTGVRNDTARMYAAMDIFVLASTCEEAFGMVLIEAMALRKPVIGTAVGGVPEIIEDGTTGTLVPPGNAPVLAKAISRYIDDRHFSAKVAAAGHNMVNCKFSETVMGDNFEKILLSITGEH